MPVITHPEQSIKLSVIIPVYNVKPFIERCVQSAVDQIGRDDEIILVDDGSADESGIYCDWFRATYGDCIKVIHQKNMGLSEARNTGIRKASGEYLVFLDSDDWFMRGALMNIRSTLAKRRTDVLICKFKCYHVPPRSEIFDDPTDFEKQLGKDPSDSDAVRRRVFENNLLFTAWRHVVKRKFLLDEGLTFMPGILHEDEEWCIRLHSAARSFNWLARPTHAYRLRSGSICFTVNHLKTLGLFTSVQRLEEMGKLHPELAKGYQRKREELGGRAMKTLPAFQAEDLRKLFDSLRELPAMSRYMLQKLKNRPIGAAEVKRHEEFLKQVAACNDNALLAERAAQAYGVLVKSIRESVVNGVNDAPDKSQPTIKLSMDDDETELNIIDTSDRMSPRLAIAITEP